MSQDSSQTPQSGPNSQSTNSATPPGVGNSAESWESLSPPYELTGLQFRAIDYAIQGMRDTQIAELLSIDRKTLWNWKTHDPEYIRALQDARMQVFSSIADRYRTLLMKATLVMAKFLDDSAPNNRFRASYALLMMAACFKPPAPPVMPAVDDWPMPVLPPKVG
jgi:hypothetical protein